MKAYRSFFVCSLCAHIVLLAYTERLLVSAPPRPRLIPVATIFEKAVPLPMGEPAPGPPAGERQAPPPAPEPVVIPPPPLQTPPQPPKKVRKKPTPRPLQEIAKVEPPPAPPLPVDNQPTIAAAGNEVGGSSDGDTSTAATEGGGRVGSSQGNGRGGAGGGGEGGSLAKPDYGVNPKPPYPMVARRMGAEGIVTLRVFVYPDGSVGEVRISRSSGFSILDDSALNTVRDRWRFVPARLDGQPVESWVEVPIRFVLEKG